MTGQLPLCGQQKQLEGLSMDLDAAHAVNRSLMAELNRPGRNHARA